MHQVLWMAVTEQVYIQGFITANRVRRYMAEMLPIRRKTLSISINKNVYALPAA